MVYGALCAHAHKFPLAYRALNLNLCRQHATRLHFHTRSLLLSHPFNFNHTATPFKPSLLRIRNSRLFSLSDGGSGGNGARGSGGSNGPNSGGSGGSNSGGGNEGHKWSLLSWYLYLSKLVTLPGASGAFLRLVLDQFLFSPIFIGVFLATLVTLEGNPSQAVPKLKQEWFSAVQANWKLWIPFQFLNFRFVPQQFQVLAANVIALAWNVILSFKAHKEVLPK